jgi:signal transduction histidine kinase
VLPFAAIDFDDPFKARQAVELSGCAVGWPAGPQAGAQVCTAIGRSAFAGGFVYVVVDAPLPPAFERDLTQRDLRGLHRARITVTQGGEVERWTAPFEAAADGPVQTAAGGLRGRLTGFAGDLTELPLRQRPERDFRGWFWQERTCAPSAEPSDGATCARRTLLSLRVPVAAWREALFRGGAPTWPPADLARTQVRLEWLGPDDAVLFDSLARGAEPPFSLAQLAGRLGAGETLRLVPERPVATAREFRGSGTAAKDETLSALEEGPAPAGWLASLILRLPDPGARSAERPPPEASDEVVTPAGRWRVTLSGDFAQVDRQLIITATRLSGYVGAMLAAVALAWLLIELALLRRIARLTRRVADLGHRPGQGLEGTGASPAGGEDPAQAIAALRGRDELGLLAGTVADLLRRVREAAVRERIQAERERDMWHAVGHEIMSPLQSLMVLHGAADDPSHRYVQRMQQAVRVLYGKASPGEAITAAALTPATLDLDAFLRHVAHNAGFAGVSQVVYAARGRPALAQADEYALEDVITHLLHNADRHRVPGTPITLELEGPDAQGRLQIGVHNVGPGIAPELTERIFEYGFRGDTAGHLADPAEGSQRGQGLFVARTYLGKMGGTLRVEATPDGPRFVMSLVAAVPVPSAGRGGSGIGA